MLKILKNLQTTVKTTELDLKASSKGDGTRTVIVHPRLGKDEEEAKAMADQTPTESGKWKGWLYQEIQTEMSRVNFGTLPRNGKV